MFLYDENFETYRIASPFFYKHVTPAVQAKSALIRLPASLSVNEAGVNNGTGAQHSVLYD